MERGPKRKDILGRSFQHMDPDPVVAMQPEIALSLQPGSEIWREWTLIWTMGAECHVADGRKVEFGCRRWAFSFNLRNREAV